MHTYTRTCPERSRRNRYDSFLVWLYCNGKEHLVPGHIRDLVPHSTASTWRSVDVDAFVGHELRQMQREALDQYELFHRHQNLRRIVRVITKVWVSISGIVLPVIQKQEKYTALFINAVQRLFTVLPRKVVFKIAGTSATSFYERLARLKIRCGLSPAELCIKRHPLQLAAPEVQKIKKLFADPELACWPAISLYYHGLRHKGLYISLSTFYKYVDLLGLKRKWKSRPVKTTGIEATTPNQYLHVDTTLWQLENGRKAAIAFVSDNYSRIVLGRNVSMQNSAANIKAALDRAIATMHRYHPGHLCTTLVADGGRENHAVSIDELLGQTEQPEITKVIALKDIRFSNSPVEAINRIMKRYLRHHKPRTFEALLKTLEQVVADYNRTRPHGSLRGLTPVEAYINPSQSMDFRKQKLQAKAQRIAANRKVNCTTCREKQ